VCGRSRRRRRLATGPCPARVETPGARGSESKGRKVLFKFNESVYYKARALRLRRFRPEATLALGRVCDHDSECSKLARCLSLMYYDRSFSPGRILVDIDCNNLNPRHPTLKGKCCEALMLRPKVQDYTQDRAACSRKQTREWRGTWAFKLTDGLWLDRAARMFLQRWEAAR
jgi:hypothetical protein